MNRTYARIYAVVKRIPKGRVATYGQVAVLARMPRRARQVGYALSALTDQSDIPWHRVVNAMGEISRRKNPIYEDIQRALLKTEKVRFDTAGRINLARFGWQAAASAPKRF